MLSLSEFFAEPDLVALVTDRHTDFTLKSSSGQLSDEQKASLVKHVGHFIKELVNLRQVHGSNVLEITRKYLSTYALLEADGLITREANMPLTVRTADCLSVFMFDPQSRAIGLVHAGWKGSRQRIVPLTIRRMQDRYGTDPRNLKVAFGPAIRSCCYQVGPQFLQFFPGEVIEKNPGYFFDLPLANKRQLLECEVQEENFFDCGLCTACDPQFFSFRREGAKAGRMISVMMLRTSENSRA